MPLTPQIVLVSLSLGLGLLLTIAPAVSAPSADRPAAVVSAVAEDPVLGASPLAPAASELPASADAVALVVSADDCPAGEMARLSARLRGGLGVDTVFGMLAGEAPWVLYPVTPTRPLPASYAPADLVWTTAGGYAPMGAQPMRALIVPHLTAMLADARADGVTIGVYSGYRSYHTQIDAFEGGVRQQLARGIPRAEAEVLANRFRARPGHSQHQLGTTVDLTTPPMGNRLTQAFGETPAGRWVAEHAWRYGFIIPYTPLGEPRTGYAPEPWHIRWVGHELAALLMSAEYLERAEPVPDDYLLALDALLAGDSAGCSDS